MLAPVVRGRKGNYDTLLADLATQGYARAIASTASCIELCGGVKDLELARYENHDHPRSWWTGSSSRDGIERRLTDSHGDGAPPGGGDR